MMISQRSTTLNRGGGGVIVRVHTNALLVLLVLVASAVVSSVSAELLTFCPPGENAVINTDNELTLVSTTARCFASYQWIQQKMLPACLAAGRRTPSPAHVSPFDLLTIEDVNLFIHDYFEGQGLVLEDFSLGAEGGGAAPLPTPPTGAPVNLETTSKKNNKDDEEEEESSGRRVRRRGRHLQHQVVFQTVYDRNNNNNDNDDNNNQDVDADTTSLIGPHSRHLARVPDCFKRYEQCKVPRPPLACCTICPRNCYTTQGGRRRRNRHLSEDDGDDEDGDDEEDAPGSNESNFFTVPTTTTTATTTTTWEVYATESRKTLDSYLNYVDALCSTMFQLQGAETGCFGDEPSKLQCTSYFVV